MPISKVKKERWFDAEGTMEKGRGVEDDDEERRELLCCILMGDLGHFAHEHICCGAPSSFPEQCQPD